MTIPFPPAPFTPQGWVCPKCGAVMAPQYPTCWYCRPTVMTTITPDQTRVTIDWRWSTGLPCGSDPTP